MDVERLRALERRFRETGAVADEARWLTERVRVGLTREAALAFASELGYPAARAARGEDARPPVRNLTDWARLVGRYEDETICARSLFAAARLVGPLVTHALPPPRTQRASELLALAEELFRVWPTRPPESQRDACRQLFQAIEALPPSVTVGLSETTPPARTSLAPIKAREVVALALRAACFTGEGEAAEAARIAEHLTGEPAFPRTIVVDALDGAHSALAWAENRPTPSRPHDERLRAAVLEAIVPWLLSLDHGPSRGV